MLPKAAELRFDVHPCPPRKEKAGPMLGVMAMRPHFELTEEDERQNKQQRLCIEDAKDN